MNDSHLSSPPWLVYAAAGWWLAAAALLLAGLVLPGLNVPWLLLLYCAATVLASGAAYAAYALDKWLAGARYGRRVPERILHLLAVLGGWPGALLAQQIHRHKTRKWAFGVLFWSIVALHLTLVALLLAWWGMGWGAPG